MTCYFAGMTQKLYEAKCATHTVLLTIWAQGSACGL